MSGDEGARGMADTLWRVMLMRRKEVHAANEQAASRARVWREEVNAHGQHGRSTERHKRTWRIIARKTARAAHRAYHDALRRLRNEVRRSLEERIAALEPRLLAQPQHARIAFTFEEGKS
jgi:hypothetical protein